MVMSRFERWLQPIPNRRLRVAVGVVGGGEALWSLLGYLRGLTAADVHVVCLSESGATVTPQAIQEEYPWVAVTPSREAFLATSIEAVILAVPLAQRSSWVRSALQARKHVWVAAPLGLVPAETARLLELAHCFGKVLRVGLEAGDGAIAPLLGFHEGFSLPGFSLGTPVQDLQSVDLVLQTPGSFATQPDLLWDRVAASWGILRQVLPELPQQVNAVLDCAAPGQAAEWLSLTFTYGRIADRWTASTGRAGSVWAARSGGLSGEGGGVMATVRLQGRSPLPRQRLTLVSRDRVWIHDSQDPSPQHWVSLSSPQGLVGEAVPPKATPQATPSQATLSQASLSNPPASQGLVQSVSAHLDQFLRAVRCQEGATVSAEERSLVIDLSRLLEAVGRSLTQQGAAVELLDR